MSAGKGKELNPLATQKKRLRDTEPFFLFKPRRDLFQIQEQGTVTTLDVQQQGLALAGDLA